MVGSVVIGLCMNLLLQLCYPLLQSPFCPLPQFTTITLVARLSYMPAHLSMGGLGLNYEVPTPYTSVELIASLMLEWALYKSKCSLNSKSLATGRPLLT